MNLKLLRNSYKSVKWIPFTPFVKIKAKDNCARDVFVYVHLEAPSEQMHNFDVELLQYKCRPLPQSPVGCICLAEYGRSLSL